MTAARPRIIASIEARMGSSRLPGKVLAEIAGRPALGWLAARLRHCRRLDGMVLATSTAPADDALEAWARGEGLPCHRGSEDDVLQRVVDAQASQGSDIVVEVSGDTPLADPGIIDWAVETFLANDADVVSTTTHASWPQGIDAQVFRLKDLAWVAREIRDPAVREHVSLYFYEHPECYHLLHLPAPPAWRAPEQRLQLDYPEDLAVIRGIVERLAPVHGEAFGIEAILALRRAEPGLFALNAGCRERAAR